MAAKHLASDDLAAVLAEMESLFNGYRRYDLTTDILAGWRYHIENRYQEASLSCICDLGLLDDAERYRPIDSRPDFIIRFPDHDYAIIGEVKATLSIGDESLMDLKRQVEGYCQEPYLMRDAPQGSPPVEAAYQDILVIVPANSATAVANYLSVELGPIPHGKQLVLVQFVSDDTQTRSLYFSEVNLQLPNSGLRDAFLPLNRRISTYLGTRIELRVSSYDVYRKYIVCGNDGVLSSLGVLLKLLEVARDEYGIQLRKSVHDDSIGSRQISFAISDLHDVLNAQPFESNLSLTDMQSILRTFSLGAPYFSICEDGNTATYSLKPAKRFDPFRKADLASMQQQWPLGGETFQHAFRLACGIHEKSLLKTHSNSTEGQLSLF